MGAGEGLTNSVTSHMFASRKHGDKADIRAAHKLRCERHTNWGVADNRLYDWKSGPGRDIAAASELSRARPQRRLWCGHGTETATMLIR